MVFEYMFKPGTASVVGSQATQYIDFQGRSKLLYGGVAQVYRRT